MQKHSVMPYGLLHDRLSLEALETAPFKEGHTPSPMTTRSDTYSEDTNNITKDDKYQWYGVCTGFHVLNDK